MQLTITNIPPKVRVYVAWRPVREIINESIELLNSNKLNNSIGIPILDLDGFLIIRARKLGLKLFEKILINTGEDKILYLKMRKDLVVI